VIKIKKAVALPRPADITTYIEAYYQYKYAKNDDLKLVVDSLESLINDQTSQPIKQYLTLYYGTVCDVADSLHELEEKRASLEDEINKWYKKELTVVEGSVPQRKKEIEKALSYGLEAVLSYYITRGKS